MILTSGFQGSAKLPAFQYIEGVPEVQVIRSKLSV